MYKTYDSMNSKLKKNIKILFFRLFADTINMLSPTNGLDCFLILSSLQEKICTVMFVHIATNFTPCCLMWDVEKNHG